MRSLKRTFLKQKNCGLAKSFLLGWVGVLFVSACSTPRMLLPTSASVDTLKPSRCTATGEGAGACETVLDSNKISKANESDSKKYFIPEILQLRNGATLPPDIYTNYPLRKIGESLVERLRQNFKPAEEGSKTYDFSKPEILIFSSGRHLQSWGTEAGKPNVYTIAPHNLDTERLSTESRLSGLDLKTVPEEPVARERHLRMLPNYGQLNVDVRPEFAELNTRSSEVYGKISDPEMGGIVAVPHEFVKRRTTFFPMDSNMSLIP